ncbi:hypothetical protein SAMN04488535_1014 [Corynebacterium mycetoides]|uniref:Uncharacterized protein n=1 Tax=Corynebacterium mycetoides TaxID=38302 RepID=A0A1G9NGW1_9CORY|nr:hypothetical protein SAMN04488535_1014 [Corynebacterium mycetoides]
MDVEAEARAFFEEIYQTLLEALPLADPSGLDNIEYLIAR